MITCVCSNVALLLRALNTIAIGRDSWATMIFTPAAVVMHVAGDDQSCTAAASVPRELFSDYAVDLPADGAGVGQQFMVHVHTLMDALTLAGPAVFTSQYLTTRIVFPSGDGRLLVEQSEPVAVSASGHARVSRCALITRPVRDRMLDLRFQDSLVTNRLAMRGDAAKRLLADLMAFQCDTVTLRFDASGDAVVEGRGSHFGSMRVVFNRSTDGVTGVEVGDAAVVGRYLMTHFASALSAGPQRQPQRQSAAGGGHGQAAAFGQDASASSDGSFSRLTLNVNMQRQLCVMHRAREHDVQVRVDVVITPAASYLDEMDA